MPRRRGGAGARDGLQRYASSGISVTTLPRAEPRVEVGLAQVAHRLARLAASRCRRAAAARRCPSPSSASGMLRLVGEHVEAGALDGAGLQRGDQRGLVDDRAARDVDERALLAERREHLRVHDVPRGRAAGTRDHEEIGLRGERLKIGHVAIRHVLLAAPGVRDLHAERLDARSRWPCRCGRAPGCRRACPKLGRELGTALQPFARMHEAIEPHEAAARHHDEGDGDVGDVVGQHVGRVGHLDAALACSSRPARRRSPRRTPR